MTEPSFNSILNLASIDTTSVVSLSTCPPTPVYLTQMVPLYEPEQPSYTTPPTASFLDDFGNREFVVMSSYVDDYYFYVYKVNTGGTPSITLASSVSYASVASGNLFYWIGIKKISDTLYYVYYATSDKGSFAPATYLQFRKLIVVPGVSVTDSLIENITLDTSGGKVWTIENNSIRTVGRTGNVPLTVHRYGAYIYSLDMETEGVTGGLVFSPSGGEYSGAGVFGFNLFETMGTLEWCLSYSGAGTNPSTISYHVVVSGTDYLIADNMAYDSPINHSSNGAVTVCQYNSRDSMVYTGWGNLYLPASNRFVRVVNGVPGSAESFPIGAYPTPITFHSSYLFPAICGDISGFYTINPTTGELGTAVSVSGVTTIYDIFPTLDVDGTMYMFVQMADSSYAIIGVDSGFIITRQIPVTLPSTSSQAKDFNHGNFFIQWDGTNIYVTYIINLPNTFQNVVNCILELN